MPFFFPYTVTHTYNPIWGSFVHSTKTHLNRGFNPPHETETQTREEKKKRKWILHLFIIVAEEQHGNGYRIHNKMRNNLSDFCAYVSQNTHTLAHIFLGLVEIAEKIKDFRRRIKIVRFFFFSWRRKQISKIQRRFFVWMNKFSFLGIEKTSTSEISKTFSIFLDFKIIFNSHEILEIRNRL